MNNYVVSFILVTESLGVYKNKLYIEKVQAVSESEAVGKLVSLALYEGFIKEYKVLKIDD